MAILPSIEARLQIAARRTRRRSGAIFGAAMTMFVAADLLACRRCHGALVCVRTTARILKGNLPKWTNRHRKGRLVYRVGRTVASST
jgi:hypothetical protein